MEKFEYQGKSPQQVKESEYLSGIILFAGIVIVIIGSIVNWIIG